MYDTELGSATSRLETRFALVALVSAGSVPEFQVDGNPTADEGKGQSGNGWWFVYMHVYTAG